MRESDIFSVCYRISFRSKEQFERLLLTGYKVDLDPYVDKDGIIIGIVELFEELDLSELKDFLNNELISESDCNLYIDLLSDFDENIVSIPDWSINYYLYLGCKEMLFSYTLRG